MLIFFLVPNDIEMKPYLVQTYEGTLRQGTFRNATSF